MKFYELLDWFYERPDWIKAAIFKIRHRGQLTESDIDDLVSMCVKDANNQYRNNVIKIPSSDFKEHEFKEVSLQSISDIQGVNRLSPKKPLNFGTSSMSIVYGQNGSGKSSYVRLLKHICGVRDGMIEKLHQNVFNDEWVEQSAKIVFTIDGNDSEYIWDGKSRCDQLSVVDIFDTSFGSIFLENEDEVSYEPPILAFLSYLIDVCDKVATKLNQEADKLPSRMPNMPSVLFKTNGSNWIQELSFETTQEDVERYCSFNKEDKKETKSLQERISEVSPIDKANQIQIKKGHIDTLIKSIELHSDQLSDSKYNKIKSLRKIVQEKNAMAKTVAEKLFANSKLDGIGSEVWKELWTSAKKYSEEIAYKEHSFPYTQDDATCVLCHQSLAEDAKKRFVSFESFIKDQSQIKVQKAIENFEQSTKNLTEIQSEENLKTIIDATDIQNEEIVIELKKLYFVFRNRRRIISSLESDEELNTFNYPQALVEKMQNLSDKYVEEIEVYNNDAKKKNLTTLQEKLDNLEAKKWLFENKDSIQKEILRLQQLEKLEKAKKTTDSSALSRKKSVLAQKLITDAFAARFNNELKKLGASKIKVKIDRKKTIKGRVLHSLKLIGVNKDINLSEILSEGEKRVVSIAAFLADVTGRDISAPFIFDDPISSLSQNFEERVVQRLCELANGRQVIIFTHRISLLVMVQDYAQKINIKPESIGIREEPWGTGEPDDVPLWVKKPDKALNKLINEKLLKSENIYNTEGWDAYELQGKGLCSEFRILLERIIETVLISDVVQRFRRSVTTQGKLEKLAKISKEDCDFFDCLMTKYSVYEHSQPNELFVSPLEPSELKEDFDQLRQWLEEFKNREEV